MEVKNNIQATAGDLQNPAVAIDRLIKENEQLKVELQCLRGQLGLSYTGPDVWQENSY